MKASTSITKVCISVGIILLLVIVSLVVYSQLISKNELENEQGTVIVYVPGWKNKGVSQKEQVQLLKKIYPHSKICVKLWESQGEFNECKKRADAYTENLAEEICAMRPEEQRKLILIGHSLGGRIAVKTLARLKAENVYIRKGVFLGSAIPDNAPEIAEALRATMEPCINIYSKEDYVLRHVYNILGENNLLNAFGAYGYSKTFYGVHMRQYEMKSKQGSVSSVGDYKGKLDNHNVEYYMKKLAEVDGAAVKPEVSRWRSFIARTLPLTWTAVEQCCNWKLETQKITSIYRIINAHGQMVFSGDKQSCMAVWKQYSTKYSDTAQEEIDKIVVLQDKKNEIMKIVALGWQNLDETKGWRLQRNQVLFRGTLCRIVDPKDFQRALGSEKKMREAFEHIKKQVKE